MDLDFRETRLAGGGPDLDVTDRAREARSRALLDKLGVTLPTAVADVKSTGVCRWFTSGGSLRRRALPSAEQDPLCRGNEQHRIPLFRGAAYFFLCVLNNMRSIFSCAASQHD